MLDFLNIEFWNNTLKDYLIFAAAIILSFAVMLIIKKVIIARLKRRAKKTQTQFDNAIVKMLGRYILPILLFAALYSSTRLLVFPEKVDTAIYSVTLALVTLLAASAIAKVFIFIFNRYWEKKTGVHNDPSVRWIGIIIKAVVWLLAILVFLDNLGIKITALIAGLGVGGIAIAFAANAILQDLFSFVTIFFDRPFEIGDMINVGEMSGTIEHIGVKTTRVRSLSGEQLIFSNTDLTNSRIRNFKRMETRRVAPVIGVTYSTPSDKLKLIPQMMREIIESVENVNFDRAHLKNFGDSAILFELVYFVLSQEYVVYMDVQQEINLKIKEAFDKNGIEFAFPSQSIYIEKND